VDEYQVRTGAQPTAFPIELSHARAQAPSHPVPHDGSPYTPTDAVGDANAIGRAASIRCALGKEHHRHRIPPGAPPLTPQRVECRTIADPSDQADNRARAFRRRARTIARPARVRMRSRKPCRLARLRVLGWYVRFTFCLLEHAASSQSQRGLRRDVQTRPRRADATRDASVRGQR
jgi:hypothetical protein